MAEVHRHLDVVVLPDGTQVTAASFHPVAPYERARPPDYGLYLDSRWRPPWDHGHLDWPDFGVPASTRDAGDALRAVLARARAGQVIEIGCLGGHGRTGTALACLAILAGHPAPDAITWVRSAYCPKAVETPQQEAFVAGGWLSAFAASPAPCTTWYEAPASAAATSHTSRTDKPSDNAQESGHRVREVPDRPRDTSPGRLPARRRRRLRRVSANAALPRRTAMQLTS